MCVCVCVYVVWTCAVQTWTVTYWLSPPGALQIENSEESDQGKYECVAVNSAGTRYSAPANLYVRGKTLLTLTTPPFCHSGCRFHQQGPLSSPTLHRCSASWLLIGKPVPSIQLESKSNLLMPVRSLLSFVALSVSLSISSLSPGWWFMYFASMHCC